MEFKDCKHDWNLPPGAACPDCLWDDASLRIDHTSLKTGLNRLQTTAQALEAALRCIPEAERAGVAAIAKENNIWSAIREARRINRQEGISTAISRREG